MVTKKNTLSEIHQQELYKAMYHNAFIKNKQIASAHKPIISDTVPSYHIFITLSHHAPCYDTVTDKYK